MLRRRNLNIKMEEKLYEPSFQEREPTLKEKADAAYKFAKIFDEMNEKEKKKLKKKLKLPRKAKVSKGRMKKGWVGVLFLNENRVIKGEKVKLEGGTYKTKDDNYHVTDGRELIFWDGKFPILFQRHDKLNPTKVLLEAPEKNEVYGQDQVYLRMKGDLTKSKSRGKTNWLYIILILAAGYFLLKAFFPGLFGG